jgi:hypothetical protein
MPGDTNKSPPRAKRHLGCPSARYFPHVCVATEPVDLEAGQAETRSGRCLVPAYARLVGEANSWNAWDACTKSHLRIALVPCAV